MTRYEGNSHRALTYLLSTGFTLFCLTQVQAGDVSGDRATVVHVLNRITFGPRPGDVEMVEKIGIKAYVESQLHPEAIDDSAVEASVAKFDLLQMTPPQLNILYRDEVRNFLKNQREGKMDDTVPAIAKPAEATPASTMQPEGVPPIAQSSPTTPAPNNMAGMITRADQYRAIGAIGQLEEAKLVRAIESPRQLQEVLVDFWSNHFNIDIKKGPEQVLKIADDRDVIRAHIWSKFRALLEASAKSPAMLFYLDNAQNGVAHDVTPEQQQMQAMRIQQYTGQAPDPAAATQPLTTKKEGGINENYAREIMELHTLGVDGGYTQQDVQEVARCFTGWSVDRATGEFMFRPFQHDNGAKVVLGHNIPAGGGMQDGETVLDILCAQPACAHFISRELCQRFVADNPPAALVDRIAGLFQQTGGDLRRVTEAILTSPEFMDPANYGNKFKSPLEFAISAERASGATFMDHFPPPFDTLAPALEGAGVYGNAKAIERLSKLPRQTLNWHIVNLGEPLFACTPPNGYTEVSSTWVNPGALIERLNFAMALTQEKIADVQFNPRDILAGTDLDNSEAVLNRCVAVLLHDNITDSTRKVLEATALPNPAAESQTVDPSKLIALIIGSPEFQRK
jgi:uncharacterized protein (DUF1800 family)